MGLGAPALNTNQKHEAGSGGGSGPPFVAGSAINGLSVDPITDKIILGQQATGLPGPADFIYDTQTFLQGHTYTFLDSTTGAPGDNVRFQGQEIKLNRVADNSFMTLQNQGIDIFDNTTGNETVIGPAAATFSSSGSTRELILNNTEVELLDNNTNFNVQLTSDQLAASDPIGGNNWTQTTQAGVMQNTAGNNYELTAEHLDFFANGATETLVLTANDLMMVDGAGNSAELAPRSLQLFEAPSNSQLTINTQAIGFDTNSVSDVFIHSNAGNILNISNDGLIPRFKFDTTPGNPGNFSIVNGLGDSLVFTSNNGAGNARITYGAGTLDIVSIGGGLCANFDSAGSLHVQNFITLNQAIQTGDPGSGLGAWKMGTKIAAASVFDGTHYVEININGVLVKLAVVS